jgi:hypothetical protein
MDRQARTLLLVLQRVYLRLYRPRRGRQGRHGPRRRRDPQQK